MTESLLPPGSEGPDGWSDPAFAAVIRMAAAQAGLNLVGITPADAEHKVRRAMQAARMNDPREYLQRLQAGDQPIDDLLVELTVGETYFFRHPEQFAFVRERIVPALRRRTDAGMPLRVWSAGCASGEEPYSLAIAFDDLAIAAEVIGTDISPAALRQASEANYRSWALRGLEPADIARWFAEADGRWRLAARFRDRVTFARHNLAGDAAPPRATRWHAVDIVFCRNVLIYLDRDTICRATAAFAESLADDGWLITGPSDPPLQHDLLEPVTAPHGILYRKRAAALAVPVADLARDADTSATIGHRARSAEFVRPPDARVGAAAAKRRDDVPAADGAEVTRAFAAGDYQRVLSLTAGTIDAPCAELRLRALANLAGPEGASKEAGRLLLRFPLSVELHLLAAVLHIEHGDDAAAIRRLKRVLYLDRSLIIAHYLMASSLQRQHRHDDARRACEHARGLAAGLPPDTTLPLSDGARAGAVAAAADAALAALAAARGRRS